MTEKKNEAMNAVAALENILDQVTKLTLILKICNFFTLKEELFQG